MRTDNQTPSGKTPGTDSQRRIREVRGQEGDVLFSVGQLCLYTTFKGSMRPPQPPPHTHQFIKIAQGLPW